MRFGSTFVISLEKGLAVKKFWIFIVLSLVMGTTFGWTMNYFDYGHREARFGEIRMDGSVNAENVMEKLKEFQSDSQAVAEVEGKTEFDFGVMAPGSTGKHSFVIRNTGEEPLTLELGATTCKCTLSDLQDNQLEPGESTSIDLEWTVTPDKKSFQQSAEVRTNDPLRPAIRLTVSGLVIRDIEFDPDRVTFGEIAAGEAFEFETKMFSYFDDPIELIDGQFGSKTLNELATFSFEPIDPAEEGGVHMRATEGFKITVSVKEGMRQGPVVTNMMLRFRKSEEDGKPLSDVVSSDSGIFTATTEVAGGIIGALRMIETTKIRRTDGGGFIWNLGRIDKDAPLEYTGFVALKGSEAEGTNLNIGEVKPSGVIEAEFADPKGKGRGNGSMRLFRLRLKITPGDETLDLLGKNKDDFGSVWIESDNPKVPSMRVAVKLLVEPRP